VRLVDVNVLVYAHRTAAPDHHAYRRWLEGILASDEPFGIADLVLSGFLRVATHPAVFDPPTSMEAALRFVEAIRSAPNAVRLLPGEGHWEIFMRLCRLPGIRGNRVPDAYLAALAIESGSEWITTDRGFGRFPGLTWRHPLG
jgi:hypothetical protein